MERVTLLFDREMTIGVPLRGYRLVPGVPEEAGLPVEAFLRLYAVDGDGHSPLIAVPGDLSPLVAQIGNENHAWAFLRLFTSPATHYLFQKSEYTIDLRVTAPGERRDSGTITPDVAEQIGYEPPQMAFDGHEYVARRDLVRAQPVNSTAPGRLVRRRESLAQDGAYRLLDDRDVAPIPRHAVIVPAYE